MGRFAPTPSGGLHLGSLFAAAASYLDARAHGGRWILRMEDLDRPREVPGAAEGIVRTLESYGFEWDGALIRQSARTELYREALDSLARRGLTFACACSRSQLENEARYPGTCRELRMPPDAATATRLRVAAERIAFSDAVQGEYAQDMDSVGDFIVRRRDQIFAYVLAVVVDDAEQGVNHVIRGADLLEQTPRQLYLGQHLALPAPRYAHVPLLVEPDGGKLAKSKHSVRIDAAAPLPTLMSVFGLLGMRTLNPAQFTSVNEAWRWAIENWRLQQVPKRLNLQVMR